MARRLFAYGQFIGLDTVTAAEVMSEKFMVRLANAYVDFRGQLNKAPGRSLLAGQPGPAISVQHYGAADALLATADGGSLTLRSTTGLSLPTAFSGSYQTIDYTQFGGRLVAQVKGQPAITYDGISFNQNDNIPQGGTNATLINRMVVGDLEASGTELKLSAIDDINSWAPATGADKPGIIDIKNQLTSQDAMRGLGVLEGDKLAIFCQNETLLYAANTDIDQWQIIRDFRVPIGCIGRRTIKPVGVDLFFCSQFGVHSLRRAISGLTLETITLSAPVRDLYEQLVDNIPTGREPHAAWNPNLGQYQILFPRSGDKWDRLTYTYEPAARGKHRSWSFTEDDKLTDLSYFAGDFLGATYDQGGAQADAAGEAVDMDILSPVLWQGAPNRVKRYRRMLVRATGSARFQIKVYDQDGKLLQTSVHQPNPGSTFRASSTADTVPARSPERPIDIPCRHRARGLQVQFLCDEPGTLKILDYALEVDF